MIRELPPDWDPKPIPTPIYEISVFDDCFDGFAVTEVLQDLIVLDRTGVWPNGIVPLWAARLSQRIGAPNPRWILIEPVAIRWIINGLAEERNEIVKRFASWRLRTHPIIRSGNNLK